MYSVYELWREEYFDLWLNLIHSSEFSDFADDLYRVLIISLKTAPGKDEPKVVERLVNNLNTHNFPPTRSFFKIEPRSVFIHGGKSHVKYKWGKQEKRCELGDAVFIVELRRRGLPSLIKLTFSQFKRLEPDKIWTPKKNGDFKQLLLLALFPEFEGISGIFKGHKLNLEPLFLTLGTHIFIDNDCLFDLRMFSSRFLYHLIKSREKGKFYPFCWCPDYHCRGIIARCMLPYCIFKNCFQHIPESYWSMNARAFAWDLLGFRVGELLELNRESPYVKVLHAVKSYLMRYLGDTEPEQSAQWIIERIDDVLRKWDGMRERGTDEIGNNGNGGGLAVFWISVNLDNEEKR